ncbi:hypothetical protein Tco_1290960, partial [Tanacetum coccineum]
DNLKMEMEMEIPSVKASANSDIVYFFTSAQDGEPLQDDALSRIITSGLRKRDAQVDMLIVVMVFRDLRSHDL